MNEEIANAIRLLREDGAQVYYGENYDREMQVKKELLTGNIHFESAQEQNRIIENVKVEIERINKRAESAMRFATIQEQKRIIRLITKEVPPGLAGRFIKLIQGDN